MMWTVLSALALLTNILLYKVDKKYDDSRLQRVYKIVDVQGAKLFREFK